MFWNENKECMPREQMRELQGKRLQKLVTYVYHNVPFYRKKPVLQKENAGDGLVA